MKKTAILLLSTAVTVWAGYSVQVLTMGKTGTMEPEFLKKLEAKGLTPEIVKEGEVQKVRVGSYDSYGAALEALMEIRCKIARDAFIVKEGAAPAKGTATTVAEKAATEAPKKSASAASAEPVAAPKRVAGASAEPAAVAATVPQKGVAAAVEQEATVPQQVAVAEAGETPPAAEAESQPPAQPPCTCICDRRALHKAQIGAAIAWYKASPYHRFDNEAAGWSRR